MAAPRVERFFHHSNGRPPIVSQHSSSVPSTPHQHPRDLRFPSRSPSPSRTLGNQSPHSVVSEAPGIVATRRPDIGCIYERAPDFKRRRIPYKDGGNEPLGPPEKEPKKMLEPHEEDKLSGDMRELYDRLLPSAESEKRRGLLIKKLETTLNQKWPEHDIRVNVFGSSGNLLSSDDSDVDICLTTPMKELEKMHALAEVLDKSGMEKVVCRALAKVPIIKFWDPELQLACDMNVNNPLALENTRMIKTYVQLDDRVRPLAKIIKYWTKRRILNDAAFGGTISSYTWICMIMNFLQTRNPPILPSLQRLPEDRRSKTNGRTSDFADDVDRIRGFGDTNKESLGSLLFHFFRYYGYELDYSNYVISVKEGRLLSRKEKGWNSSNYHDKEAQKRLCVEEPFNTNRNLGNSADDYAWSGIHQEIRRAFDLIADGKLESCCAEYEFPPEEKSTGLFQRPKPQPKPILTRSASQSGRPHAASVSGKNSGNTRNSRNASSHRAGSRRASSGAAFGHQQRFTYLQSPPVGMNGGDYFSTNGLSTDQLHEQLYKQYQYLQAQQEALRTQLLQQQNQVQLQAQAQAQVHGSIRSADVSASPRQRTFANNIQSSRTLDSTQASAPLLPGYLYHYPARYPPPSPLSQSRTHDRSSTQPSSPSLAPANPTIRRTVHRSSLPEASSTAAVRSQSQPGRSFPSNVTLQSLAHPGYDVSGAIGAPYVLSTRSMQLLQSQQNGYDLTNHQPVGPNGMFHADTAMPKEYVGYYVGQSPQLGPQYPMMAPSFTPILREVPSRMGRDPSPEYLPPGTQNATQNGIRGHNRSPSPLSNHRSQSTSSNSRSAPLPQIPFQEASGSQSRPVDRGPVIVNGSTPIAKQSSEKEHDHSSYRQRANESFQDTTLKAHEDRSLVDSDQTEANVQTPLVCQDPHVIIEPKVLNGSTPITTGATDHRIAPAEVVTPVKTHSLKSQEDVSLHANAGSSPRISPNLRARPPPRLNLSPKTEQSEMIGHMSADQPSDITAQIPAPILSPVVEMRTPSPTSSRGLGSPQAPMYSLAKSISKVNGKLPEESAQPKPVTTHVPGVVNGSGQAAQAVQPVVSSKQTVSPTSQPGAWQQATRKGHKKSKSGAGLKPNSPGSVKAGGEPLPENEADRKGG